MRTLSHLVHMQGRLKSKRESSVPSCARLSGSMGKSLFRYHLGKDSIKMDLTLRTLALDALTSAWCHFHILLRSSLYGGAAMHVRSIKNIHPHAQLHPPGKKTFTNQQTPIWTSTPSPWNQWVDDISFR